MIRKCKFRFCEFFDKESSTIIYSVSSKILKNGDNCPLCGEGKIVGK